MRTVESIGEHALIERLVSRLGTTREVVAGPGDDCAVVRNGTEDWLLTSDAVIEGVHFTDAAPPRQVGHKAVARALSDIAAMGGEPRWALIDLVAPHDTALTRLDAIYAGMAGTAARYGLSIVGGDVARGPVLELHLFAVGRVPAGSARLRSGAHAGDAVYVTGTLGGSRGAGKHLAFAPRIAEGLWLREGNWISAMCDVSDGLATDLHHLCDAGKVGAVLRLATLPLSTAVAASDAPVQRAMIDGEDFELLFTVPIDKANALEDAWSAAFDLPCTRIGTIVEARDIAGIDATGTAHRIDPRGFDHFTATEDA